MDKNPIVRGVFRLKILSESFFFFFLAKAGAAVNDRILVPQKKKTLFPPPLISVFRSLWSGVL